MAYWELSGHTSHSLLGGLLENVNQRQYRVNEGPLHESHLIGLPRGLNAWPGFADETV